MTKKDMENGDVIALIQCLNQMTATHIKLSPKVWYALSKTKNRLVRAAKDLEEARSALVKQYSTDKKRPTVDEDKMPEFKVDYKELLEQKAEVEIHTIHIDVLVDEMDKMEGVDDLYLFFDYIVDGDLPETPAASDNGEEKKEEEPAKV